MAIEGRSESTWGRKIRLGMVGGGEGAFDVGQQDALGLAAGGGLAGQFVEAAVAAEAEGVEIAGRRSAAGPVRTPVAR